MENDNNTPVKEHKPINTNPVENNSKCDIHKDVNINSLKNRSTNNPSTKSIIEDKLEILSKCKDECDACERKYNNLKDYLNTTTFNEE